MAPSIERRKVEEFLAQHRFAVVGASDKAGNFGLTVYRELRDKGYDVVPVNPHVDTVDGAVCHPDLASVPGELDGVIVMVPRVRAADVVRACVELGIPRVWLFRGVGAGAVSDEAVALCHERGIEVVAGACPLMFLEPVGSVHRFHRGLVRLTGRLAKAA